MNQLWFYGTPSTATVNHDVGIRLSFLRHD